jgi:hypothetical protein
MCIAHATVQILKPQRGEMYIETPNPYIPKPQRGDMCVAFYVIISSFGGRKEKN